MSGTLVEDIILVSQLAEEDLLVVLVESETLSLRKAASYSTKSKKDVGYRS